MCPPRWLWNMDCKLKQANLSLSWLRHFSYHHHCNHHYCVHHHYFDHHNCDDHMANIMFVIIMMIVRRSGCFVMVMMRWLLKCWQWWWRWWCQWTFYNGGLWWCHLMRMCVIVPPKFDKLTIHCKTPSKRSPSLFSLFGGENVCLFWNVFPPSLQDVAQVTNLTVEAGGEAILRCTSSNPAKELANEAVESKGPSNTSGLDKGCKWELGGKEIQLSSTRHSLSSDESRVSVGHVTQQAWLNTILFWKVQPQCWLYMKLAELATQVCELRIRPVLTSDAGRYICKSDQLMSRPGELKVVRIKAVWASSVFWASEASFS